MKKKIKNPSIVRIGDVKEGTILIADGDFTCMADHAECVVRRDGVGDLFVKCDEGKHYLAGQECRGGTHGVRFPHYIGFWIKGSEPPTEIEQVKASLRAMLDVYWQTGDGAREPEFILKAIELSGWQKPPGYSNG